MRPFPSKKAIAPFLILFVLACLVAAVFFLRSGGINLAIVGDAESQLKEEYKTIWSDSTNGDWSKEFTASGRGSVASDTDAVNVAVDFKGSPETLTSKKVFNGEDVALLLAGGAAYSKSGQEIGCSVSPGGSFRCTSGSCAQTQIIYRAHTLDKGYDVIQDGVKVSDFDAPSGFSVSITCESSGGRSSGGGSVQFLGQKARFCDVRDNEVWIQEQFSSPVSIKDLSYKPTQFCHEARPFTLRALGAGEKPIGKGEGIIAFNRGETIPKRALKDEVLVINYATPAAECGLLGCKMCSLGKSNIKVNGRWECQNFLRDDEPRTIKETEVIVAPSNSFELTATKEKPSFSIGDLKFTATQSFACTAEEGAINYPPNPSKECYISQLSFGGTSVSLMYGSTGKVSDSLKFQYLASGSYTYRKDRSGENLAGRYIFTAAKTVTLRIAEIKADSLVLEAVNYLPPNQVAIAAKQAVDRAEVSLADKTYAFKLNTGSNLVAIPLDKANLGTNELSMQAFYPVEGITLDGDKLTFGFEVQQKEEQKIIVVPPQVVKEIVVDTKYVYVEVPSEPKTITKYVEVPGETTTVTKYIPVQTARPSFLDKIIAFIKKIFS